MAKEDEFEDELDDSVTEDVADAAEESEEGFTDGFEKDDEISECAECGKALKAEDKKISKEFEGEKFMFCSAECAKEFEDSLKKDE